MTAAAARTRAELFAGAAYDPSAAPGGLLAWQRPTGVALLQHGDAAAVGLPGRNPAVGPGRVAWREGDRLVVADPASLAPVAAYDAPGAGAFALSELWLAWRVRDANGANRAASARAVAAGRPVGGARASASAHAAMASASTRRRLRRMAGRSHIVAVTAAAPRGAKAITGSARPAPNASPSATPSPGSPSATLIPASAHTAKERTKVVKASPSSAP